MNVIAPEYYNKFSCLMGGCHHSCCKDWEIDIDDDSLAYFNSLPDELRSWILGNITQVDGVACFRMTETQCCPFLNSDGLCEMILRLGKESLCDICLDHPVFRNWYSDRLELGLGLCCEAACNLILSDTAGFRLCVLSSDGYVSDLIPEDEDFFVIRSQVLDIALRRDIPVHDRVNEIELLLGISSPEIISLADYMKSLEMMDVTWKEILDSIKPDLPQNPSLELPLENLLIYLIYRHSCRGFAFPVAMWHLIRSICLSSPDNNIFEICRMWSCEIEYSDINPELISEYLCRTI